VAIFDITKKINKGGHMNKSSSDQKPERSKAGKLKSSQLQNISKSTGNKRTQVKDKDGILVEAARKIETGAKVVGEKAVDVADKLSEQTSEFAEIGYEKIKKGVSDVYDVSSKTISDISKKAVKYVKKYENTVEMKKLSHDRNVKMQELGSHIFALYKSKTQEIKELLANDESKKIINDLEVLNKAIVKIGRKIKRKI
jgi:hypothetical protein